MLQPYFSPTGFTIVKNNYIIHVCISPSEGFLPYKTPSNYKRPKFPLMIKGGGFPIFRMFYCVPIAIITHTFSHFKFFGGGNSDYLKNSSLKYSPLLRGLINQYGGVKNEPTKD